MVFSLVAILVLAARDAARAEWANFYFDRGVEEGRKGQYDWALAEFTKALEINPRFAKAYFGPGVNEYFVEAAKRGDLPEVKRLLAKGADVNAKDRDGLTALMMACSFGHREIVQALLAKGADVHAKNNHGNLSFD